METIMAPANLDKLKQVKEISRPGIFFTAARVPDSTRFFLGNSDFKVYEADLSQDKPEFKELYAHASYVTGVCLAGKMLVSGGYDGKLIWWHTEDRKQVRSVEAHSKWIRGVTASRDAKMIASVADDMVCRLWNAEDGKLLHELKGHEAETPAHFPSMLYACTFSNDGKYLATADKVGHVVVWDVATGKSVNTMEAPGLYTWDPVQRRHSIGGIRSVAFSPDGKTLAVGGIGKIGNVDHLEGKARVEVFAWEKAEHTHEMQSDKFNGLVEHLEFHPDGDWLLGAGGAGDGFLLFFDLKDKKVVRQEKAPMHIHDVAINEASDTLYTVGYGKVVVFEMKG
jgi:WD40 repeat protein